MNNKIIRFLTKYRWIVVAALCVVVGLVAFGWFNNPARVFAPGKNFEPIDGGERPNRADNDGASYVPDQLVGLFDDEEQAKECAELYGIELLSFNYGVAVFQVEGDPREYIAKGEKNGWHELSLNYKYKAF